MLVVLKINIGQLRALSAAARHFFQPIPALTSPDEGSFSFSNRPKTQAARTVTAIAATASLPMSRHAFYHNFMFLKIKLFLTGMPLEREKKSLFLYTQIYSSYSVHMYIFLFSVPTYFKFTCREVYDFHLTCVGHCCVTLNTQARRSNR